MATSGTANFAPSIFDIIEEAFERCGLEFRNGYDITTARRSLNLLFMEWANKGVNMWTLETGTVALVAGQSSYDLPADTVDILSGVIRSNAGNATTQTDIEVPRISLDSYLALPNKLTPGPVVNYCVERLTAQPTVKFWFVPNGQISQQFVYIRLRRIQDAGTNPDFTADVPFRFVPALISGLAYHVGAKKRKYVPLDMLNELKMRYDNDFAEASNEDRDRSDITIRPMGYF